MIITRTPFRISFFGGGTDYPAWYEEHGGTVLSTTINKYCYISCRYLPPFFDYKYRLRYNIREETASISDIKHPVVRECLRFLNIEHGIEMVYTADLPARSGIGSSSSFTVGFLNALYALAGKMISKRQLALDAIYIEQDVIKESVGAQDQVAAAFGGFNKIEFGGDHKIFVQPVTISQEMVQALQDNFMLFFTGFSRNASEIAVDQIKNTPSKKEELKAMKGMVDDAIAILNSGVGRLDDFGKLLGESWRLKRNLSSLISSTKIDEIYETAMRSGALGGKLLGAGGGGFMLFYVPKDRQHEVRKRLKDLLYVPFHFEKSGSHIILYAQQDFF